MNKVVRFAAYILIMGGLMVVVGWTFNIFFLKCLITASAAMKFNSALLFILLGIAFWNESYQSKPKYLKNIALLTILLWSTAVLSQYLLSIDLGIDELFYKDPHTLNHPGRMSPVTLFCFIVLSVGLLLVGSKQYHWRIIAQYGFNFVTFISVLSFIGHVYRVPLFYHFSNVSMAAHTSMFLIIGSVCASYINPTLGVTGLFVGTGTGSTMARILFPATAIFIFIFGWVRIEFHRWQLVDLEAGTVVFTAVFILITLALVAITAHQLNKIDAKRILVEESYVKLTKSLESKIVDRTAQLNETMERFDVATHGAEIGIWEVSLNSQMVKGNKYFYKFLETAHDGPISLEEMVEKIHPEDRRLIESQLVSQPSIGASTFIFRIPLKDKSIRYLKVIWTPEAAKEGHEQRVYGACIDVTAQIRFEEELHSQYTKIKAFIKDAPTCLAMLDNDLKFVAVSDQWLKEYPSIGYLDVVEESFSDRYPSFYADLEKELALCKQGHVRSDEAVQLNKENGEQCWVRYVLTPWHNDKGAQEGVIMKMMDITLQKTQELELREAKERLTLAVEVTGVGIYEWDLIHKKIYVDEIFSKLYGYEYMSPEEAPMLIGKALHEEDRKATSTYIQGLLNDPTSMKHELMFRVVWPDGSIHHLKSKGSIMRDENGQVTKVIGTNVDITLQKTMEDQLTKAYNTIKTFVESAPSAIAMFDKDLRYLAVSNQWIKDYRLERKDIIGVSHYEVFPEIQEPWKSIHQACLQGETIESQGEEFVRTDGTVQWVKYVVCPWYDADTSVGGIIMHTSDITEQRNAVDELMKTKERLQLATESSKVGVWDWDVKTGHVYWDDQMFKLYGVEGLKGKDPQEILEEFVHPEDKQRVKAELKMALQGLMDLDTEFRVVWSNGMLRHIKAKSVVQRDGEDRAVRMVGTNLDITQLKVQLETLRQSEERYFKMVNEVQDYAIVLLDHHGKIENWNYGAEKIFDYSAVEIVGSSIEVFFTTEDINNHKIEKLFMDALDTGRAQDEGWRVKKSGNLFLGNTSITALHGMNKEIIGFSMVIHDLTERKKAELTEKMEAKNKELEQITYIASHDLQEPLRTITGIVNIMNQQYVEQLDEEADKYLKFMRDASERMRNLIKGLLDYSRMGKGNELIYFDSGEVLSEIIQDLAAYIQESEAEIQITGNLPYVRAYKTEFRLLLQNLISNAIKFRRKGAAPEVIIQASKENNSWKFSVKDNGIGIEPRYQEKIFMIFQRLHNRSEYEGTGIGLSHCKKIVELHGGRIWVDSFPGEGSTFHFTIPI